MLHDLHLSTLHYTAWRLLPAVFTAKLVGHAFVGPAWQTLSSEFADFTSAACLEPACSNARIALYSWIGGYILELAELQRRIPGILCTPHTHLLHVRNVALTLRGVVALEQCSDGGLSQQKGVNI